TQAHAQEAELSQQALADFVYGACYADRADAVDVWRQISAEQQKLVDWFEGKRYVQVTGSNVDLSLSIEGRSFVNADGRHNMPDGEIFTGPVEDSMEGWVRFTYPAHRYGVAVDGIEMRFEEGKVVEASAEKNEDFLHKMLDTDAGASYVGEFAISTNDRIDRFVSNILFDEKIGGSFHLAVGSGYPQTGSENKSGIHWDMICDLNQDGEIWVDGELIYREGDFLLDLPGV
ncbi:MAG: aminopeptidase, partial [Anaerolineales bacterium]|nr:aminopeptidase [Anaerolineales bacterium]